MAFENLSETNLEGILELLVEVETGQSDVTLGELVQIHQRLRDIAYLEHGLPMKLQQTSERLALAIQNHIFGLEVSDELKQSLADAIKAHERHVAESGRGSLSWELAEARTQAELGWFDLPRSLIEHLDKTSSAIGALGLFMHVSSVSTLRLLVENGTLDLDDLKQLVSELDSAGKSGEDEYFQSRYSSIVSLVKDDIARLIVK